MIKTFEIPIKKYDGRNAFGDVSNHPPEEFLDIVNYDLYSGKDEDDFKTRRGSAHLGSGFHDDGAIFNKIVLNSGGTDYLITQEGKKFYHQALPTGDAPVKILRNTVLTTGDTAVTFDRISLNFGPVTLYFKHIVDISEVTLEIYSDIDLMDLVASATKTGWTDAVTVPITEENSSGLSGFVRINNLDGNDEEGTLYHPDLETGDEIGSDLKLDNGSVFVFNTSGNLMIVPDSTFTFLGMNMGLTLPRFTTVTYGADAQDPPRQYIYGLEKVLMKDGVDLMASTPNRKDTNGQLIDTGVRAFKPMNLYVDYDSLFVQNEEWTHVRVWRTKTLVADTTTDPLFPIDAQGIPEVLYELALITRAELEASSVTAIATGASLPAGNVDVRAGMDSGDYVIEDSNVTDERLSFLVDIDLIELIPIPAARTGAISKGRVWFSGIDDIVVGEDVLYTTDLYHQYKMQWDVQAFVEAGRDGQRTNSLHALDDSLIVFRSASTKRISGSNPDSKIQKLDEKIGLSSYRHAGYIPEFGICAVCSDGIFRYFGKDLRWHEAYNKLDVSFSVSDITGVGSDFWDFVYANGKLIMVNDSQQFLVLHAAQGKGWTRYSYPAILVSDIGGLFSFSNDTRFAYCASECYLVEIEKDIDTDADAADIEATEIEIQASHSHVVKQMGNMLEVKSYSFWGKLSGTAIVSAYSNQTLKDSQPVYFDANLLAAAPTLNEREYRFTSKPTTVGWAQWVPLRGHFIKFNVATVAPAMFAWQKIEGVIRPTKGNFGIYPDAGILPQVPGWSNALAYAYNFEDPDDIFYDASGNRRNLTWVATETPTADGAAAASFANIEMTGWDGVKLWGRRLTGGTHTWRLWSSEADRDGGVSGDAVAQCVDINSPGHRNIVEMNSSGIFGVVDIDSGGNTGSSDDLDLEMVAATKENRITQRPGKGVSVSPQGSLFYSTSLDADPVASWIGNKNITWKAVVSNHPGLDMSFQGNNNWKLTIPYGEYPYMEIKVGGDYFLYSIIFPMEAETEYAVTFVLDRNLKGHFYIDALTATEFSGERPTTKNSSSSFDDAGGIEFKPWGVVSWFSAEQGLAGAEQAERWWRTVRNS